MLTKLIANNLGLKERAVENTIALLQEGATIPFIARYRKERTGGLDEVQIGQINDLLNKFTELQKRKETILKTIDEQGKLTNELRQRVDSCWDATTLEDIYLPYKPKRRTRAQMARVLGLEPLANIILLQREKDILAYAERFVKGDVKDTAAAIRCAQDIIAENISEDERSRSEVRQVFRRTALITSKVVKAKEKEEQAAKYRDYFDFAEPLRRCSSHRMLAMRRGEAEGFLRISIAPEDEDVCLEKLERRWVKANTHSSKLVTEAVADAYKRLMKPSIENEFAALSKEQADDEAIRVFSENLRQLLLAAPLGQKRVMGVDPGFRTGCKVVCMDAQGNLLHFEAIYPHQDSSNVTLAAQKMNRMLRQYAIEAIAIGNGTASRETKDFIVNHVETRHAEIFVVSEDGASVYSASKLAREEFPDQDVTVRGAVSIGRRLMDPLAELVKIEPKSIGVGQYQHDVDQTKLKKELERTVESCVNMVGVDVNTASPSLLTYVSGLGPVLAKNIVEYRREHGPFTNRNQLKKVPRLGPAAYEQCAGFLRISNAVNPLDNSAVHPERYALVEQMARDCGCTVSELIADKSRRSGIHVENYVNNEVGLPTLNDIMQELEKPGRDPRGMAETFEFDPNVKTPDDLHAGMVLPGIVTNITNFGAFVDIGVHQDGLVHISQLADRFVKNPNDVVKLGQHVSVKVVDVDKQRHRISLTMRI